MPKKKSKINLSPLKAIPEIGEEAWFYENKGSIDVYIYSAKLGGRHCRIKRSQLADWIKRTAK